MSNLGEFKSAGIAVPAAARFQGQPPVQLAQRSAQIGQRRPQTAGPVDVPRRPGTPSLRRRLGCRHAHIGRRHVPRLLGPR